MGWVSKKKDEKQESVDVNSILELPDIMEAEMQIDGYLNKKSAFGDELENLTAQEKIFLFVENLLREVNNGGFNQWFFNSSGDYVHETIAALDEIGAVKIATIVKQAVSFWPEGKVPKDRSARQDILQQIEDSANSDWAKLDNLFYTDGDYLDDYSELLIDYVRKNKESFKP